MDSADFRDAMAGGDYGTGPLVLDGGRGSDTISMTGRTRVYLYGDFRLLDTSGDRLTLVNGASGSRIVGANGNDVISADGVEELLINALGGDDDITITGYYTGSVDGGDGNDMIWLPSGLWSVGGGYGGGNTIIVTTRLNSTMRVGIAPRGAGDRLDLSVYGTDLFSPGGLLTIAQSGADTVIADRATNGRIVIVGVDSRNLSSFNLGSANPLYDPQNQTIENYYQVGADQLVGADGDDRIYGYGGNDILRGSGGSDELFGGDGSDALYGGTGSDLLTGGSATMSVTGAPATTALTGKAATTPCSEVKARAH